ncbi:MAG TPA: putative toxin-antitoxin system toxin component, PIN family [Burkholderiales bacterium]|nr:putative toxin-antitoxin system toxin component, PIN family [Burkholderiales bacterium]
MRLVLDTNIWLDWLVFQDTGIAHIRQLQGARHLEICIDAVCEAELVRVLGYPFGKRQLNGTEQAAAIARCRRIVTRVDAAAPAGDRARLPACRDPDDQKFLEAALAARADWLITKDRALLDLARKRTRNMQRPAPFKIGTPDDFEDFAIA